MSDKQKWIVQQISWWLGLYVTVVGACFSEGLIVQGTPMAHYFTVSILVLGTYGITDAARKSPPRTPWTDEQRAAFRATHPEVQKQVAGTPVPVEKGG